MTDQHLIDSVRRADPVGDLGRLPEPRHDALALLALADEERVTTTLPPHTTPPAAPPRRWLRPVTAFAVALVLVLGLIGMVALLGESPVGDETSTTTTPPETTTATPSAPSVLFIGDSHIYDNGGVDAHLEALAASADPPLTITSGVEAAGGYTLEQHWQLGHARDLIQGGDWDVVVLQGYLAKLAEFEFSEESFYEYVRKFNEVIDGVGARTVLFMTWEQDLPDALLQTTTEMIAEAHDRIAAELGADVAPAGLAWQRSILERPELALYGRDHIHPSATGTYLAVCVLYATIFDQSPVGLAYQPADLYAVEGYEDVPGLEYQVRKLQLTDDEVAFLQRIAWETVADYRRQQP